MPSEKENIEGWLKALEFKLIVPPYIAKNLKKTGVDTSLVIISGYIPYAE